MHTHQFHSYLRAVAVAVPTAADWRLARSQQSPAGTEGLRLAAGWSAGALPPATAYPGHHRHQRSDAASHQRGCYPGSWRIPLKAPTPAKFQKHLVGLVLQRVYDRYTHMFLHFRSRGTSTTYRLRISDCLCKHNFKLVDSENWVLCW